MSCWTLYDPLTGWCLVDHCVTHWRDGVFMIIVWPIHQQEPTDRMVSLWSLCDPLTGWYFDDYCVTHWQDGVLMIIVWPTDRMVFSWKHATRKAITTGDATKPGYYSDCRRLPTSVFMAVLSDVLYRWNKVLWGTSSVWSPHPLYLRRVTTVWSQATANNEGKKWRDIEGRVNTA